MNPRATPTSYLLVSLTHTVWSPSKTELPTAATCPRRCQHVSGGPRLRSILPGRVAPPTDGCRGEVRLPCFPFGSPSEGAVLSHTLPAHAHKSGRRRALPMGQAHARTHRQRGALPRLSRLAISERTAAQGTAKRDNHRRHKRVQPHGGKPPLRLGTSPHQADHRVVGIDGNAVSKSRAPCGACRSLGSSINGGQPFEVSYASVARARRGAPTPGGFAICTSPRHAPQAALFP